MKSIRRMKENEHAVSPIVATLVLIVVAVVGAVAVGTIMGTFSSDVSKQASSGDVASRSSTEILAGGSTTVYPLAVLAAQEYMKQNQGVKITVQPGGSGVGITGVGQDLLDIGMSSEELKDTQKAAYPNLVRHEIGGSAVVVIANKATVAGGAVNATKTQIENLYKTGTAFSLGSTNPLNKTAQRSDTSGTEDTFSEWLLGKKGELDKYADNLWMTQKQSNDEIVSWVATTEGALAFTDYGFAAANDKVQILGIDSYTSDKITRDNIKAELKDKKGEKYITKLTRPLLFFTNGQPSAIEKSFIDFVRNPAAKPLFDKVGYIAFYEYQA